MSSVEHIRQHGYRSSTKRKNFKSPQDGKGYSMEYKVIYTNKATKEQTREMLLQADNIRQARQAANSTDNIKQGEYCKVYNILNTPQAIQEASIEIIKRTTANMISREGGEIQYRLYNAIRHPHPSDPDIMDCIGVVNLALWEYRQEDEQTAYSEAYKALNKYLYDSRQIRLSVTAMRTVFIEDIDGDIINVNKGINAIIKASDPLPNIEDEDEQTAYINALTGIIIDILKDCTPVQKRVIKLIAEGNSERQTADKMNREKKTIHEHKQRVIKKALAKYPNGIEDIKALLKTLDA